ncbi:MAG TPA: FHA domain-containing protein [Oligoflexia bacterium]|nr:FHA domain-containing protein [Oligoflexia bacterium]HMP27654.1 FHA domain-containing protein [Oligoflexia bacterium]
MKLDLLIGDTKTQFATFESDRAWLGRTAETNRELSPFYQIASTAVSRKHGVFRKFADYWYYLDEASTNGSFLNGTRLTQFRWYPLRDGDLLRMADVVFVVCLPNLSQAPSNLTIFREKKFLMVKTIEPVGRALEIGGTRSEIEDFESPSEKPSLIIEKKFDDLNAFQIDSSARLSLNGIEVLSSIVLRDRDLLMLGDLIIYFNDPARKHSSKKISEWERAFAGSSIENPEKFEQHDSGSLLNHDEQDSLIDSNLKGDNNLASETKESFFENTLSLAIFLILSLNLIGLVLYWLFS